MALFLFLFRNNLPIWSIRSIGVIWFIVLEHQYFKRRHEFRLGTLDVQTNRRRFPDGQAFARRYLPWSCKIAKS
jgi:hypothetical protein